jgi:hypothetical protein|tara:strand:+ start:578 stop:943 length:366 start_codon:yes stop_codon:yes gene_type:complete
MSKKDLFEEHNMVKFNRKLFELGMASYNDPSNPSYEIEARRIIYEFKSRINAAARSENNELAQIIRLTKEYQQTLKQAQSLCHPSSKDRLIESLEKLNNLHDQIHKICSFLSHKALGGIIY